MGHDLLLVESQRHYGVAIEGSAQCEFATPASQPCLPAG